MTRLDPPRRRLLSWAVALACLAGGPAAGRAAGPVFWDYPAGIPFRGFELSGAGLDEHGRLAPGLAVEPLALNGPEVVWAVAPDGRGGAWLATGHDGQVWRVGRDGASRLLATLPAPEIFALRPSGDWLFAGTGPGGVIFRVAEDGEAEPWADLEPDYVWSLADAGGGRLYAATGSPAAVWRLDGRDRAIRLAGLPAAHAMDVAVMAGGGLLVVTQGPGLICEVDPSGARPPRVWHETGQDEVRQLVAGPDAAWYALAVVPPEAAGGAARPLGEPAAAGQGGSEDLDAAGPATDTAAEETGQAPSRPAPRPGADLVAAMWQGTSERPRAVVYRVAPDGLVTRFWWGDVALGAIAHDPRRGWLGVGGGDPERGTGAVWGLSPPAQARPLASWEGGEAIDLAVEPAAGDGEATAWVALARPGRALRLTGRLATAAAATSAPLDGGVPIRWARLRWEGEAPAGAQVRFSARGGPRARPDSTWSAWSGPWTGGDEPLPLPPSRFLQWRVEFSGQAAGARVATVTVSGREPNLPPAIARLDLQPPGELSAGGPFGDGSVTESFASGLRAEYNLDSRRERRADPLVAARLRALRTFTWQARDPNDDRLSYALAYRPAGEEGWRQIGSESPESVRAWDTAGVPDGWYVVRLTASDAPDNAPGEALTDARLTAPLLVDNTAPALSGFRVERAPAGVRLRARASDAASPLAEAWVELPDGRTVRLDPVDGVCDSRAEEFDALLACPAPDAPPPAAPWRVRAGFLDRAGNVARAEGEAR